jgi:hypothetical protein
MIKTIPPLTEGGPLPITPPNATATALVLTAARTATAERIGRGGARTGRLRSWPVSRDPQAAAGLSGPEIGPNGCRFGSGILSIPRHREDYERSRRPASRPAPRRQRDRPDISRGRWSCQGGVQAVQGGRSRRRVDRLQRQQAGQCGGAGLATLLEFGVSTLHPEALAGGLSAAFRSDTHDGTSPR